MRLLRNKQYFMLLILAISLAASANLSAQKNIREDIDWPSFMIAQNIEFNKMPTKWEQAPYFGNGFIGSMIYADSVHLNQINIQVFRTDVHDHRNDSSGWTAYSRPRLMIGNFIIHLKGQITGSQLTQDLFKADLSGSIKTTVGSIDIHHFIAAEKDLILTEVSTFGKEAFTVSWQPHEAKSTRKTLFPDDEAVIPKYAAAYGEKYNGLLKRYAPNPGNLIKKFENISLSVQNLLAGGQYVVAWKQDKLSVSKSLLSMTIQNSYPDKEAESKAIQIISKSSANTYSQEYKQHIGWWSKFYKKSFLSIPDKQLERLYWLQMYKFGSACRANGPVMDTSGPWFQDTPWPYITWDLNVQLCYWALNTSNHLDVAMSLPNSLNKNKQQLINNVKPVAWREDAAYLALATAQDLTGSADDDKRYKNLHANLPWIMHNVWLMYRYSMDKNFLRTQCYPLLKRSINYYLHIIKKESDGKYHIPMGYSPEYPGTGIAQAGETKDANIDIALLKWGLQALIESSEILNIDAEQRNQWKDISGNLVDFPVDENGFSIGAGMPYTLSHRHYSHLLMVYPLYLINVEENSKDLMERSLKHWVGDPKGLRGYSYTGASSISAAIGNGNKAIEYLKGLNNFLLPNGLYKEAGPCFETPLSAAQSIQDMLLQSWGSKIRIFPAVPDEWKNIVFHNWLAEGAFEISAKLSGGETEYIMIKSLAGSPCIFTTSIKDPVGFIEEKKVELQPLFKNTFQINLKKGQTIIIKNQQ